MTHDRGFRNVMLFALAFSLVFYVIVPLVFWWLL